MIETNAPPPLSVPDRFESLKRTTNDEQLRSIVVPVDSMLNAIDRKYAEMAGSHRGGFLILKGASGAGKSTFLHTIGRFRADVYSTSVSGTENVRQYFSAAKATTQKLEVFVL